MTWTSLYTVSCGNVSKRWYVYIIYIYWNSRTIFMLHFINPSTPQNWYMVETRIMFENFVVFENINYWIILLLYYWIIFENFTVRYIKLKIITDELSVECFKYLQIVNQEHSKNSTKIVQRRGPPSIFEEVVFRRPQTSRVPFTSPLSSLSLNKTLRV